MDILRKRIEENDPELTIVNLTRTLHYFDINILAQTKFIKILELGYNSITDISWLIGLKSLTKINLYDNRITDISVLSHLTNLEYLTLDRNKFLDDLRAIANLTELRTLTLGFCNITNVSHISKLPKLSLLNLSDNKITDISPLRTLTTLKHLNISNNPIKDVYAVCDLVRLTYLDMDYIELDNLDFLQEFRMLCHTHIIHNPITDLTPLLSCWSMRVYSYRYGNEISRKLRCALRDQSKLNKRNYKKRFITLFLLIKKRINL